MTESQSQRDLEKARLDPASVFSSPEEVRDHPKISTEQKIEILRRWAYDESELTVAEEEGMMGGESALQSRIRKILDSLVPEDADEKTAPTKQKGL